jgi:hypothetical protein
MTLEPADTLEPFEWIFPEPGTSRPFAVIRRVTVRKAGVEVEAYRAVTYAQPRGLIREGYFRTIQDAARACNSHHIGSVGTGALSAMDAYSGQGRQAGNLTWSR